VVIIDSCIFIPLLRQGTDPAREFSALAGQVDIATCGVVRCEITRGMNTPKARKALSAYLDCLLYIPTPNNVWVEAEEILWNCGRKGFTVPLTDALIAACAIKAGAAVLTHDKHFDHIEGLRVLRDYPRP
jgi:predicted nucleic acid-binding protein